MSRPRSISRFSSAPVLFVLLALLAQSLDSRVLAQDEGAAAESADAEAEAESESDSSDNASEADAEADDAEADDVDTANEAEADAQEADAEAEESEADESDSLRSWLDYHADTRDEIGLEGIEPEIETRLAQLGDGVTFAPNNRHNVQSIKRFDLDGLNAAQRQAVIDDRFEYCREMFTVIDVWVETEHASTLRTTFDNQSQDLDKAATYNLLRGYLAWSSPSGVDPSAQAANTITYFERALAAGDSFDYLLYTYANFQMGLMQSQPSIYRAFYTGDKGLGENIQDLIDGATEAREDFAEAIMLRAEWRLRRRYPVPQEDIEESRADCKTVIELQPHNERLVLQAITAYLDPDTLYREEEAESYIPMLLKRYGDTSSAKYNPTWHARMLYFQALLDINHDRFELAWQRGEQAVALLETVQAETDKNTSLLQFGIRNRVVVSAYALAAGNAERNTPERKALIEKRNETLEACIELDLNHVEWYEPEKGSSVFTLANYLQSVGALEEAYEVMADYDQRAARLKAFLRARLRDRMGSIELLKDGVVPIGQWVARNDADYLAAQFEILANNLAKEPEFFKVCEADVFEVLEASCESNNRELARWAMDVIGFAAAQEVATDDQIERALAAILAGLRKYALVLTDGSEPPSSRSELVSIANRAIGQISLIDDSRGARTLITWLEEAAENSLPAADSAYSAPSDVQGVFRRGLRTVRDLRWPEVTDRSRDVRRLRRKLLAAVAYPIANLGVYEEIADVILEEMDAEDAQNG